MAACTDTRHSDRIIQDIARLAHIYAAPVSRAEARHAMHQPSDPKFVRDLVSCGATRLLRHARRDFGDGKVGAGCARLFGAPFAGALAALALAPAGMGYWVGRSVAQRRCARGLERTDVGIHEDKLATALLGLKRSLATFAPIQGSLSRLTASDQFYMGMAGDVRQVLWDLDYRLRDTEHTPRRIARSPLLLRPLRQSVRMADRLDDQRRKRAAAQLLSRQDR